MVELLKRNLLEVRMAIQKWLFDNLRDSPMSWEDVKWKFKMDFEVLPDDDLMFLLWKIFREMLSRGHIKQLGGGVYGI